MNRQCKDHPRYQGRTKPKNIGCAECEKIWIQTQKEIVEQNKITNECQEHTRYKGALKPNNGCAECWDFYTKIQIKTQLELTKDIKDIRASIKEKEFKKKHKALIDKYEARGRELNALTELGKKRPNIVIGPSKNKRSSEATAIITLSDAHFGELVTPDTINQLNAYNLEIAKQRTIFFFQNALRLLNMSKKDIAIKNVILALLGDFITGSIHEEAAETNLLHPIEATHMAQTLITSGIEFLLKNTDCNFTIPCHSGNHGRITKKIRNATMEENSLEHFMYLNLAKHFENEKRVTFILPKSYHSYIQVYDKVIRFHHGHNLRYRGGVGGIYIPVNKAIAQWNKGKKADLDVFGHFHQFRDGGNFICNGSLIGYNAYAMSIKADFERPKQAFFLIDKDRGKTIVAPILLESN